MIKSDNPQFLTMSVLMGAIITSIVSRFSLGKTIAPGRVFRCCAFLMLICSFVAFFVTGTWGDTPAIPAGERTALLTLYTFTNGASWTNSSNWNGDVGTECTWYGVTCNAEGTHVVSISLISNNLSGPLPDLSGLTNLQRFDVGANQLTGSIPVISGLTNLQAFYVSGNRLTGSIPDISGLTNLQAFVGRDNQLTGTIPDIIGLSNLLSFDVANNRLTGSIPDISGLTSLSSFNVYNNRLTGLIPDISGLINLQFFDFGVNRLTGSIPDISGLTLLYGFGVDNNQLTGSIPDISGLTNLQQIRALNNQLTGSIPDISGLTNLSWFSVANNRLTGSIPLLSGLNKLQVFEVSDNQLTGSIPDLSGLTNLWVIRVSNNQLTGDVPAVPTQDNLIDGGSSLCPNKLNITGNTAWNAATGVTPWYKACMNCQVDITRWSQGDSRWNPEPPPYGSYYPSNYLYPHTLLYPWEDFIPLIFLPRPYGYMDPLQFRMRNKGCCTTSLAMALEAAHVYNLGISPPYQPKVYTTMDPGSLNVFIEALHMYTRDPSNPGLDSNVIFAPATQWAGLLSHPSSLPLYFNEWRFGGSSNPDFLAGLLCMGDKGNTVPVVLMVPGGGKRTGPLGHCVVATGVAFNSEDGSQTFYINDPGHSECTTLEACYDTWIIRGFVTDPPGDMSALYLALSGEAELLVTDQTGKRTGFDATSGQDLLEIFQSSYFRDFLINDETGKQDTGTTRSLDIFQPLEGKYDITVKGLEPAMYSLTMVPFYEDGSPQPMLSVEGIAGTGSISSFQIQFNPSPGTHPVIVRIATFDSMLQDIQNSLQLGLIKNKGIAQSLSSKIQAAAKATAKGDSKTCRNILNAFKNDIHAQTSKHIDALAAQVLLEDVNSLLTQNP
jgi:Leucine-rich repeat (LRR) protein